MAMLDKLVLVLVLVKDFISGILIDVEGTGIGDLKSSRDGHKLPC